MDFAVLAHDAAGRGDAIDAAFARADAVERLKVGERLLDGLAQTVGHLLVEFRIVVDGRILGLQEQFDRAAVDHRGRVLMDRVDGDPRGIGPGAFGHLLAEQVVGRVADFAPIDGAQDVTMLTVVEHDALAQQGVLDVFERFLAGEAQASPAAASGRK